MAFVVLVGYVKRDAGGQLGKLDLEDLARAADDVVATLAGRDATKNQDVAES